MSQITPTDAELTILASEYIRHGDKTKAWRATYPNSKAKPETQWTQASLAFDKQKVIKRIEELQIISKKNSEDEFTMTVSQLKKVLATVIKKGLKDGKSLTAAVSAVKEFNSMDGNHAPTEIDIKACELTPWSDIQAGVDEMDVPPEE